MKKKPDVKPPRQSFLIHLANSHELGLPVADGVGDDPLLLQSCHHPVQQSSILLILLPSTKLGWVSKMSMSSELTTPLL